MSKKISLFNNKGGVSKTTTTFHLGWMLAEMGKKVLIVDTDPQCNLTGLSLNIAKEEKFEEIYASDISNVRSMMAVVFEGKPEPLAAANCYAFNESPNLFLLPGHIEFSEYDTTYSIAQELTGSLQMFRNVPGALRFVLVETAKKYEFDYILVDMSPSITSTNANILMQSDYFIVPCAPDYFCYMAIESLTKVFPMWNKAYQNMRANTVFLSADYKIKETPPIFLGTIQQRFRPRNGAPAKSFARWIESINTIVAQNLIPVLSDNGMLISDQDMSNYEEPYNLINISDFNSLIAQSQKHNTPVFTLTDKQIEQGGKILENMITSRDNFRKTFELLANRVIQLTL